MELLHKVRARVFTLCLGVRVTYHYRRGKHNIFRKTVPMLGQLPMIPLSNRIRLSFVYTVVEFCERLHDSFRSHARVPTRR